MRDSYCSSTNTSPRNVADARAGAAKNALVVQRRCGPGARPARRLRCSLQPAGSTAQGLAGRKHKPRRRASVFY